MEIIAEGLGFPEGPVAMADGSVIVVDIRGGRIVRCWDGKSETISEPGGGPNGAAIGPDGALWVCNNGGLFNEGAWTNGWIERIDLGTGKAERVYESCDGVPLSGPNDLVFGKDGTLWFTDLGHAHETGRDYSGAFACKPDGSKIVALYRQAISYNGIGLSPDGKTVYVADTYQARVWRFEAKMEGQEPKYVATSPGPRAFDSLAVTAAGNVCVATLFEGGITTVTPAGETRFFAIPQDTMVTNIAFGGEDMRDAYITLSEHGQLVHTRWDEPGLKLAFNA